MLHELRRYRVGRRIRDLVEHIHHLLQVHLVGPPHPPRSYPTARKMASPAKTDLDFDLELRTASALSASGYSGRLNVLLSAVGDAGLADVTDVDVLAISRDLTFTPRVVCVSAKAGTSLVVAKELFYLRGVLSYMRGDEGVLLLGGRDVPPYLRELASSLSLLLLVKGEIDVWRSALVNGVHDPGYFAEPLFLEYEKTMNALPPSSSIKRFLSADYWFHRDFRNVQNLVAHLKKYAPALDGRGKLHATQILRHSVALLTNRA